MFPIRFFTFASLKKEVATVIVVLVVVLTLPLATLVSVTNIEALSEPGVKLYTGPTSTTNTYFFGYCTFWAAMRREQISKPIPNNWGDAITWDNRAVAAGYIVDNTPEVGSIMQTDRGSTGEGHVAFVEEVYADGGWRISEMNVKGWNILSERQFSPQRAKDFNFIH